MYKKKNIWDEDEDLFSEENVDEQTEADAISDAEAGWLMGYSDY